jgi:carotenoid cleavage dioxygenase-like enzyme
MQRRAFLRSLALAGLTPLALRLATGCSEEEAEAAVQRVLADTGPDLPPRTPASLLRAGRDEQSLRLRMISGALPAGLHGSLYVIGSVPFPGTSGDPVIVGDGMVLNLRFGDDDVHFTSRYVRTTGFYADRAATGSAMAFHTSGFARISRRLGVRNYTNTALVPMGQDRMMATIDAGTPWEIDPVSLDTITQVGRTAEWEPSLPTGLLGSVFPMVQSTAHPVWDQHSATFFTVNYGGGMLPGQTPFLHLCTWDGRGALVHHRLLQPDGSPVAIGQSVHQINVSRDWVVIMDTSFQIEPEQLFGQDVMTAQDAFARIWIVRRSELGQGGDVEARQVTLPREAAHFLMDYDNPGDELTLHVSHNNASDPSEWVATGQPLHHGGTVSEDLAGMLTTGTDRNAVARYRVDAAAARLLDGATEISEHPWCWGVALFAHRGNGVVDRHQGLYWSTLGYDPALLTRRVTEVYAEHPSRILGLGELPTTSIPASIFRIDARDGYTLADGYLMPAGRVPLSPHFIPRQGSTGPTDGWIVATVLSDDTSTAGSTGDEFWIFDAARLSDGPLCRLAHPDLHMGFTLHTAWLESPQPRTAPYFVDPRTDLANALGASDDDVRALFAAEVFPHFSA